MPLSNQEEDDPERIEVKVKCLTSRLNRFGKNLVFPVVEVRLSRSVSDLLPVERDERRMSTVPHHVTQEIHHKKRENRIRFSVNVLLILSSD